MYVNHCFLCADVSPRCHDAFAAPGCGHLVHTPHVRTTQCPGWAAWSSLHVRQQCPHPGQDEVGVWRNEQQVSSEGIHDITLDATILIYICAMIGMCTVFNMLLFYL